ncbi:MAG TPA: GNAT family N-acetyltransferase [Steroidobacteraceae bacterium]|nr:GNAT family N-acetyltransferase [Steroidobacteraceae bacterium]
MSLSELSKYELTTARLRLLPCNHNHLDGLNAINSDPEVMRYLHGVQTRAETKAMIDRVQCRWAELGYSWWTIFEPSSGQIVGAGCIQNLRRGGGTSSEVDLTCPLEIGWRVRRDRWRQGIANEAARAMAEFAFTRLRAEVLYAVCQPENKASMGVMVKLGMHYRGIEDWYGMKVTTYALSASNGERLVRYPSPSLHRHRGTLGTGAAPICASAV